MRTCSKSTSMIIGQAEKSFFRDLVRENGLYPKDCEVVIDWEIMNYGDFAVRGRKSGTVVEVSLKIDHQKAGNNRVFSLRGDKGDYTVSQVVLSDSGLVFEVVAYCTAYMVARLKVPDMAVVFHGLRSTTESIYRTDPVESSWRIGTYGAVGEEYFKSPIHQERSASDAIVSLITTQSSQIAQIEVEGRITPQVLKTIIQNHLAN
ncbi:hypothetical protein NEHOM01_1792 [Nematocida homosporus]|uniref:uncharacterized protein n=1 Tax=Nematocida homosporus TaxID=1912981 RepID=UPI00221EF34D|nr:uncharacterized protein NEHOM01_1792 [Nematocida homosporus]KAI5186908.1 hypothetical protein NEHOM01_1792 [Nematocida homosporus]